MAMSRETVDDGTTQEHAYMNFCATKI